LERVIQAYRRRHQYLSSDYWEIQCIAGLYQNLSSDYWEIQCIAGLYQDLSFNGFVSSIVKANPPILPCSTILSLAELFRPLRYSIWYFFYHNSIHFFFLSINKNDKYYFFVKYQRSKYVKETTSTDENILVFYHKTSFTVKTSALDIYFLSYYLFVFFSQNMSFLMANQMELGLNEGVSIKIPCNLGIEIKVVNSVSIGVLFF
jgi:hypothetical protein